MVFISVGAPVDIGLVESLAHPGGNMTGTTFEAASETYGKRLQLLKEILPDLSRVAVIGAKGEPAAACISGRATTTRSSSVHCVASKLRKKSGPAPQSAALNETLNNGPIRRSGLLQQNLPKTVMARMLGIRSIPAQKGLGFG